jgi:hypothetical protein
MRNNYTRQRQGRDFPAPADERRAAERNSKEFLKRLERFKEESGRSAAPADGREPDGLAPEKAR